MGRSRGGGDDGSVRRHPGSTRWALITSAPEGPGAELERRQRRYAWSAAIFIGSFAAATLLHRETLVALLLCGVAMVTLVAAVIGANIRTPRRRLDDSKLMSSAGERMHRTVGKK